MNKFENNSELGIKIELYISYECVELFKNFNLYKCNYFIMEFIRNTLFEKLILI